MDNEQRFLAMVGHGARLDTQGARRAARATLDTLFERLSGGQARDLAERLSIELVPIEPIIPDRHPELFDHAEFQRRVAGRQGSDEQTGELHAAAVLTALRIAAGDDEFDDLAAQLPHDFQPMLAEARQPHVEVGSADEFLSRVADRTGLDPDAAGRTTEAVLETLGERITDQQLDDLASHLWDQPAEALRRAKTHRPGAVRKLPAHKFLSLVADREGSEPGPAHEHTRAVLTTLRESVPDDQFYDVVLQLPNDYADLLMPQ
ncbi:DUF2267 domain-containing protein [Micromonospora sp. U21]|uniref:DUF2267 domain-containing protein n=1 Tax=Micromonospora sp. U21 TaxID=2824899 RepID=UPI001B358F8E|nr:DUF2267 domain-containing protein [Micromonospora sp. U21]MBQ0906734.1 DUF2267 domain-containing protein [Micromonospora sp. U21]